MIYSRHDGKTEAEVLYSNIDDLLYEFDKDKEIAYLVKDGFDDSDFGEAANCAVESVNEWNEVVHNELAPLAEEVADFREAALNFRAAFLSLRERAQGIALKMEESL